MADTETPPGMPGWVKIAGLVIVVVVLLAVVSMLVLGAEHGPGRHG